MAKSTTEVEGFPEEPHEEFADKVVRVFICMGIVVVIQGVFCWMSSGTELPISRVGWLLTSAVCGLVLFWFGVVLAVLRGIERRIEWLKK